ncbi:MAG TPA: hypothetical protein IAB56_06735 [Candidatus Scybalousia intestinigallinarum]|nr:hypothetical protein [Candidatus Scybalousia intestinigallinarum]
MNRNEEKEIIRNYVFPCIVGKVIVTKDFFGICERDTVSLFWHLKRVLPAECFPVFDGLHDDYLNQLRTVYQSKLTSEQKENPHLYDFNLHSYARKRGLVRELKKLK